MSKFWLVGDGVAQRNSNGPIDSIDGLVETSNIYSTVQLYYGEGLYGTVPIQFTIRTWTWSWKQNWIRFGGARAIHTLSVELTRKM